MDGSTPLEVAGELVRVGPPLGMLAELTHRCPLQCPYCSNPLRLLKAADELDTQTWLSAFSQAADLGVLQVHLSGGEPTVRQDLEELVKLLSSRSVYTNLITSGVTLTRDRFKELAACGLDHVQLSLQSLEPETADKISNYKGSLAKKLEFARWVREEGLPLTINAPTHRHNIKETPAFIELAVELGAGRIEIAHIQYYGWAKRNEAALLPPYELVLEEAAIVADAKERLQGIMSIDYVTPDYYAQFPKPCMGGWAKDVVNITPEGKVLPCHAAESLPIGFDNIKDRPATRDLVRGRSLQPLPWIQLDEGALQLLPAQGDRLRRLPLPSLRGDGRRGGRRSSLQPLAAPSSARWPCRCFHKRRAAALRLSPYRSSLGRQFD